MQEEMGNVVETLGKMKEKLKEEEDESGK